MAGVMLAFFDRLSGQEHSLIGDLFAVGAAVLWARIALCARLTSISMERPEIQLFIQLLISAPILFVVVLFLVHLSVILPLSIGLVWRFNLLLLQALDFYFF
jgi:drug/metabolite transporter (DMT)-like permease